MGDEFQMTVGQAHELEMAFRRNGWNAAEVKTLSAGNILAEIREVILGNAEVKQEHLINCDTDPFVPSDWSVEEHKKQGQFQWDPARVNLFLSNIQEKGEAISGHKLRKELAGKPVLNACVLDYLLAHPHLIPESWKQNEQGHTRYVFFWGTIYRDPDGSLCVRYIHWYDARNARWRWSGHWLGGGWDDQRPAALRASLPAEAAA